MIPLFAPAGPHSSGGVANGLDAVSATISSMDAGKALEQKCTGGAGIRIDYNSFYLHQKQKNNIAVQHVHVQAQVRVLIRIA